MTSEGEPGTPDERTRVHETPNDPEQLRREIEETRAELGATVEALSEKTDVKSQVSQKVDERKQAMRDKGDQLGAKASELGEKLRGATPEQAQDAAGQAAQKARERPLPVAVAGALALGFLLGWLLRGD